MKEAALLAIPIFFLMQGLAFAQSSGRDAEKALALPNAFFAMDTGTKDAAHETPKTQAEMLKELGYAGIGYTGWDNLPEWLAELNKNGLKLFTIYLGVSIDPGPDRYDHKLDDWIASLKGTDAILWLSMTSNVHKPSSPEGDAAAVDVIREIADKAAPHGVRVALYPHITCWLERVEDAVRVVKKVDRKNVGVTFNLFHWLRMGDPNNAKTLLETAMPYLYVVTINGTANEGTITTLDACPFDIAGFLCMLKELKYTGPVGLQGYGIGGDVHENLERSMAAWKALNGPKQ